MRLDESTQVPGVVAGDHAVKVAGVVAHVGDAVVVQERVIQIRELENPCDLCSHLIVKTPRASLGPIVNRKYTGVLIYVYCIQKLG